MSAGRETERLGVVLILIAGIVVSIVLVNGVFHHDDPSGGGGIYIPQYPANEFVEYVNDGDTFKTVEGDYIRLLGVNTEETGMPHAAVAKARLEQLLASGGEMRLEADQEDQDRYGRLLRYVWVGDVFVNLELVRGGYAHVYIIEPNVKYSEDLWSAQEEALASSPAPPEGVSVALAEFCGCGMSLSIQSSALTSVSQPLPPVSLCVAPDFLSMLFEVVSGAPATPVRQSVIVGAPCEPSPHLTPST